jgi:hypothetical protein
MPEFNAKTGKARTSTTLAYIQLIAMPLWFQTPENLPTKMFCRSPPSPVRKNKNTNKIKVIYFYP